jgi:hypothetical protein
MPQTKEYMKQYRLANKEKIKDKAAIYYLNNKEKMATYYLNNIQKIKEQLKEYGQTENGKKMRRICRWRQIGVISENFDELHEKYINTTNCEECNVELIHGTYGSNKKCLDHNHKTGQFRNVLCHGCNLRRG